MSDIRIQKPQDVKRMLVQVANEVRASDAEIIQKARVLTYIGSTILTALSQGDIESRLSRVEEQLKKEGL